MPSPPAAHRIFRFNHGTETMDASQNHSNIVLAAYKVSCDDIWDGAPGVFTYDTDGKGIIFKCPCGCEQVIFLPFDRWKWDENVERPSLTPSVRRLDGCRWHGFLMSGMWQPCSDSGR